MNFRNINGRALTIGAIRVLSIGIMGIAAYVSYGTQRGVLLTWDVDAESASLIPITVDLLAIICNLAVHAPGIDRAGRRVAMGVLVAAGLASMAANAVAGHTWGSRVAHVWTVLAYLLAEWVAARVKAAKTDSRPAVAPTQTASELAPAPVAPSPVVAEAEAIAAEAVGERPLWMQPRVKPNPKDLRHMRVLTPPAA
jgi:hypothetical protein